jgi:protein phosphatase
VKDFTIVLVVSDIHGNADALRAVVERVGRWDALWVLGDLVDYGPEPHVVIDLVRELRPDLIVMGNHDNAVAYNVDCMCAPELHDLSEYTRQTISYRLLSPDQIAWLRTLPKVAERTAGSARVYVVHGSPRNPLYGYLRPDLPERELLLALTPSPVAVRPKPVEAGVVLVGHTHIQVDLRVGGTRVVNPGSVGQPRDGDPRASYAVVDLENSRVEFGRVEYDIWRVVRKLEQLNLDTKYLARLKGILLSGRVG